MKSTCKVRGRRTSSFISPPPPLPSTLHINNVTDWTGFRISRPGQWDRARLKNTVMRSLRKDCGEKAVLSPRIFRDGGWLSLEG